MDIGASTWWVGDCCCSGMIRISCSYCSGIISCSDVTRRWLEKVEEGDWEWAPRLWVGDCCCSRIISCIHVTRRWLKEVEEGDWVQTLWVGRVISFSCSCVAEIYSWLSTITPWLEEVEEGEWDGGGVVDGGWCHDVVVWKNEIEIYVVCEMEIEIEI
jgi:hypothetical protein